MSQTVLITGAGGFIGTHLWRFLQDQGYRVQAMVSTPDAPACTLAADGDAILCGRLPEVHLDEVLAEKPAFCVHLAGGASVPASLADPSQDFHNAVVATEALMAALQRHSPDTRTVFLSSAAVYGNPACLPITEDCRIDPISPYGHHKRMAELTCLKYQRLYGQPVSILRPFSIYGPGLRKQLFWDIFRKWKHDDDVALFGDGQETRDFLHIHDLLAAIHLSMLAAAFEGEAINVASGQETSIREAATCLLTALEQATGVAKPLRFTGQAKPGDPTRWHVDIAALSALGPFAAMSLEDGLTDTAQWLLAHA